MPTENEPSTSAKILYRPVGLAASVVAGLLSGLLTRALWKRLSRDEDADPPTALQSEYALREILVAAALQGAVFAVVRALVDRGGARAFQRWTGEWPGK